MKLTMILTNAIILLVLNMMAFISPLGVFSSAQMTHFSADHDRTMSQTDFGPCVIQTPTGESGRPVVMTCILAPSDDAYVDNLSPAESLGDMPILVVQDTPSIPKSRNYAYLKFDLPGTLPAGIILSHAEPLNATVWLYVRYLGGSFNASVDMYYVSSNDWNESKLNWNNMPPRDTVDHSTRDVTANGTWYAWNASRAVTLSVGRVSPVSLVAAPPSNAWRNYVWFDSKEHLATNGLTSPRLIIVFVEPYLSLATRIPHLPVTIDGRVLEADSNGVVGTYLPWGSYNVTVPETVLESDGVRERFVGWSDNVTVATRMITIGNNLTLSANYQTQYRLDVNSPYGSPGGSGWHFANTRATAMLNSTVVFAEGLLGLLGVRHVFDHWVGDCEGPMPTCTVMMNRPKGVVAVWRDDFTITGIEVASSLIAVATYLMIARRRKLKSRPRRHSRH